MTASNQPRNPFPFVEELTTVTGFDMDLVTEPTTRLSQHNLVCPVCMGLARDPYTIDCRHVLCWLCVSHLQSKRCPTCRHAFKTPKKLNHGPQPPIDDYMAHRVRCRLNGIECGFEGNPVEVDDHQEDCVNTPWINGGCGHYVAPTDFEIHRQYHEWEDGMCSIV